jgi:hypothetical protein
MLRRVLPMLTAIAVFALACHAAPATAGAAAVDPGHNLDAPTGWHWYRDRAIPQIDKAIDAHGDRLIDIDVTTPNRYLVAMVRNKGAYQRGAGNHWFTYRTRDAVVDLTKGKGWRLIDLEPQVRFGKLRFAGIRVPNSGDSQKGWWWNYDLSIDGVKKDIDKHKIRLIDIERYRRGGKTRYAYVGIKNQGVDGSAWWWYVGLKPGKLASLTKKHNARLIDIERLPNGRLAVVMVRNEGTYWWWGHNMRQARMIEVFAMHGTRLIDVEQWRQNGERRFSFVAIDNVAGEGARIRDLLDDTFEGRRFGGEVARGAYVRQFGGPTIAGLAEKVPFQPMSVLKLLPFALAIDYLDREATPPGGGGPTTLASTVSWVAASKDDPDTEKVNEATDLPCLKAGAPGTESGSASLPDALQTMMWQSHNRTLDSVMGKFDRNPKASDDYLQRDITAYVKGLGLKRTRMYQGCDGAEMKAPWFQNRSTLADLGRLYEKIVTGQAYSKQASTEAFKDWMINIAPGGASAAYTNGTNVSPITGGAAGPAWTPGWITTMAREEVDPAKYTIADDFAALVRWRKKGGSAGYGKGGGKGWSGWADATNLELPVFNGAGLRGYVTGWWVTGVGSDESCRPDGTGNDLGCAAAWSRESGDRNRLARELFREPIRQALATWSLPPGAPNQPPAPVIASPAPASKYAIGETVALRGSAVDPEDDSITYKWSAKVGEEAPVAIGNQASIDWVPSSTLGSGSGVHPVTLTLEASDATGSRTASVDISVYYPVP